MNCLLIVIPILSILIMMFGTSFGLGKYFVILWIFSFAFCIYILYKDLTTIIKTRNISKNKIYIASALLVACYLLLQFFLNRTYHEIMFGVTADGGGNLCLNLCNGAVTYSLQFNYAGYANFGFKKFNRSWNFGGGFNFDGSLGTYPQYALMAPYCNTSPNKESCCCEN